jgi:membrane associated rhomboid family serine protease
VGASTSICGLLTGALSMIFINWQAFNVSPELEQARCILIFMLILMIVLNLVFVGQDNELYKVDTYGHLGGAMTGLFWGLAFFPRVRNSQSLNLRKIGLVLIAVFFILLTVLLFTQK